MTTRAIRLGAGLVSGVAILLFAPFLRSADVVQARTASVQNPKSIFVSVLDAEGKPVTGMTAADFLIREDNVDRTVLSVEPATEPLHIAMLVDTTTGAEKYVADIRGGFTNFVRSILTKSPESQLSLWEFGQAAIRIKDFTSDVEELTHETGRLFPKPNASSVLLEALNEASNELEDQPGERRVIVVLNLEPSEELSRQEPKKIHESLMKSRAQLWVVSLQEGTLRNAQRDLVLNQYVRNAGGTREYIVVPSGIDTHLQRIADALTSQYKITYERPADEAKIVQVGTYRQNVKLITGIFAPK